MFEGTAVEMGIVGSEALAADEVDLVIAAIEWFVFQPFSLGTRSSDHASRGKPRGAPAVRCLGRLIAATAGAGNGVGDYRSGVRRKPCGLRC